jgi:predicted ATPase/DNA-binding CsgD family transcriptional regulator/Tfp pilus assembly protein PilF
LLRTISNSRALVNSRPLPPNNLPLQLTSLVGRERETAAVCELLRRDEVRLVTLTGPPGIGKTRLGIEVAANLLSEFDHGVFFVNLAPVVNPEFVTPAIAGTLGMREAGDQSPFQNLKRFLSERRILLVLDNFEQVVEAAPRLTELLQAATGLKVLVTSRELLHLSVEHNFPVPPLSLPPVLPDQGSTGASADLSSERIARYDAVQLFAQRARALKPDFTLTESNALTVARICSRLDGLPLTIELAAARIHHFAPQAILDRLQHPGGTRLRLLTGGTQDVPARQRTLRATIEWSYNLLSEEEQRLFRRLAVFQGGSTLAAIEAVCAAEADLGIEVADGVFSLVDKNLLRSELSDGLHSGRAEPYFSMLETVHEYAREQLDASSEAAAIRRHHATYHLMLALQAETQLRGPLQADWLNRLDRERENFRIALHWTYHHDAALGLELAAVLGTFWIRRSHLNEGREWLSKMLSRARDAGTLPAETLAHALFSTGFINWYLGDLQAAYPLLQESVVIFKELQNTQAIQDRRTFVESLNILGIVVSRLVDISTRCSLHEQALEVAREIGDNWSIARSLYQLGHVSRISGDYDTAQSLFQESLALFRTSGDEYNIGLALIGAGLMAQQHGGYQSARSLFEESLVIFRALGVPWAISSALYSLGSVALDQEDYGAARSLLDESLALQRQLGMRGDTAEGLENLGRAAYFQRDYSAAYSYYAESLTLFQELGDTSGMSLCLVDLESSISQALAASLPHEPGAAAGAGSAQPAWRPSLRVAPDLLTRREREIAILVSRGKSNREIADALVVSERTVEWHTGNILSKLDLQSRTQIAAWVVDQGLMVPA